MARKNILVVEDEEDILELVRYNLKKEGYEVMGVTSGEEALSTVRENLPNLIVLDLMLPGIDGLDICKLLKTDERTRDIPVIMLTAKGEESDIVTGLEIGADDYITKPFSPKVMIARVRAALRRKNAAPGSDEDVVKIAGIEINPGFHEVRVDGKPLDLTSTEFRILHLLARKPGWVFSRAQIIDEVRGDYYSVTDRSVDVHVASLRKKLGPLGKMIKTVRGVGYKFKE